MNDSYTGGTSTKRQNPTGDRPSLEAKKRALQRQIGTCVESTPSYGVVTTLCAALRKAAEKGESKQDRGLLLLLSKLVVSGTEEAIVPFPHSIYLSSAVYLGSNFSDGFDSTIAAELFLKVLENGLNSQGAKPTLALLEASFYQTLLLALETHKVSWVVPFFSLIFFQIIFLCHSLSIVQVFHRNSSVKLRARRVASKLIEMNLSSGEAGDSSTSGASGVAERLSPVGSDAGVGVTNVLADLGSACSTDVCTLRDTLREISRRLPSIANGRGPHDGGGAAPLDEAALARLIFFFAERGAKKRGKDGGDVSISSALVGVLTNESDQGQGDDSGGWNLDVVSQLLTEDYCHLNWIAVAQKLDFSDFAIRNTGHFTTLLALYKTGSKMDLPLSSFVSDWRNQGGQLSFLEVALSLPPDLFSFPVDDAEEADAGTVATDGAIHTCPNPKGWASADVLQRLLILSDVPALARRVRDLFVRGLLSCPEVLLCSLVRLQLSVASDPSLASKANSGMQMKGELMRELIPLFFKPNPHHRVQNGPAALRRLWSISPNTVAAACIEVWRSTSSDTPQVRLATVIHFISIIRLLPNPENATATIINGSKDHEFSIAVAFVMADNELLQLGQWLPERVSSSGGGVGFIVGLIAFLGRMYAPARPRNSTGTSNDGMGAPLVSLENLALCLKFLQSLDSAFLGQQIPNPLGGESASSILNIKIGDSVKALVEACLVAQPSLNGVVSQPSIAPPSTGSGGGPAPTPGSADDIEEMANKYFQKIYTSEQSLGEVVEMLKRFKTSGNTRENDIFACMIHNLFDEYRFFSKYPEKELRITGILFGMLIQHQLVSSITLGIALRYVLEALRKSPGPPGNTTSNQGKMFRFGMFALEQFKERLHEWPQYCSHIVQIPHLKEGYADLVAEIESAMSESQAASASTATPSPASNGSVAEPKEDQNKVETTATSSAVAVSNGPVVDMNRANIVNTEVRQMLSDAGPEIHVGNDALNLGTISVNIPGTVGLGAGPSSIELTPAALPLSTKQTQHDPPRKAVFGPNLGRAVNGQLDEVQHEAPPDAVLDRVQFLINNVSPSNVEQKAQELKDMLAPKYFGWLGNYLVVKRISTQPNFHSLYLAFLNQLGDYGKGLVEAILSSVYLNVGKLLRSPKITTSTSERSLLKNLGSWLGQITLARNRPILQIMLDCKELLFQGYETGMLIAVTPFVAKILEGAKNSVVFRPPNPWLMGLLCVFRALYGVEDLKMNIKFEVEVLCKNLGVKLEDIPVRSDELASRVSPVKERNPDFNIKATTSQTPTSGATPAPAAAVAAGQGGSNSVATSVLSSPEGKQTALASAAIAAATSSGDFSKGQFGSAATSSQTAGTSGAEGGSQDQQQTVIPNLAAYVTINPSLTQLFQQPQGGPLSSNITAATLKRAVPVAVDRAIREIIQPVVERSVTIACITTKEIATKDFAMESDESKMRKAAQLMVANLAGSLALVTCREPLKASVSTHLRQLLMSSANGSGGGGSNSSSTPQLTDQEQSSLEQCVAICATDNLELGCMLIEKAATEKAVRDMDEALAPALSTRKKHREQTGQPFYDMSIFANNGQRYPAALPEPLRPKPGGLRSDQLLVYEAFQRMPRQPTFPASQQGNTGNAVPISGSAGAVGASTASTSVVVKESGVVSGVGQHKINVEALSALAGKIDNAVTALLGAAGPRAAEITLSMLPPDHDVRQLLAAAQQVTTLSPDVGGTRVLNSTEKDTILGFAQGVFKHLYELSLTEPLRLEANVAFLEVLNECCPQLGQDLGTWATYAPTETEAQRKLHRAILLLLLRSCLVDASELDGYLARSTDSGRNVVWLEFSVLFVRTAVLEKICTPSDLPRVMEILTKIGEGRGQFSQQVVENYRKPIMRLIEELGGTPPQSSSAQSRHKLSTFW